MTNNNSIHSILSDIVAVCDRVLDVIESLINREEEKNDKN